MLKKKKKKTKEPINQTNNSRKGLVSTLLFISSEPSRFHFNKPENYISMYHQEGSDTLYVGGRAMIFILTFTDRGVRDLQVKT